MSDFNKVVEKLTETNERLRSLEESSAKNQPTMKSRVLDAVPEISAEVSQTSRSITSSEEIDANKQTTAGKRASVQDKQYKGQLDPIKSAAVTNKQQASELKELTSFTKAELSKQTYIMFSLDTETKRRDELIKQIAADERELESEENKLQKAMRDNNDEQMDASQTVITRLDSSISTNREDLMMVQASLENLGVDIKKANQEATEQFKEDKAANELAEKNSQSPAETKESDNKEKGRFTKLGETFKNQFTKFSKGFKDLLPNKDTGLKLLKGFGFGLALLGIIQLLDSPVFDLLLDGVKGVFSLLDTLTGFLGPQGKLIALLTGMTALLFKPSLVLLPFKLAIAAIKFGFKLLTDKTFRASIDLKMTKAFTKLGNGVKAIGSGFATAGTKSIELAKSLGAGAASIGGKALTGIRTAGLFMKGAMLALGKGLLTFATTTIMPMLIPLAPFIAIGAAIAAVLYSLYEGFQSFRDSLASGDSLIDAIINGVSTALATLVTLPAVMFQKLLSFVTGILGFDDLSERIGSVDIVGTISGLIKGVLTDIKDFFADLFTIDTANFPSFGDFGSYAKRAIATLARSVLPEPGGFLSKFIPDAVYEFAGMNPETGALLTQQNTQDMDGGVEGAMIKQKQKLKEDISETDKELKIIDGIQNFQIRRQIRHEGGRISKSGKVLGNRFVSEAKKNRATERASYETRSVIEDRVRKLRDKEAEAVEAGTGGLNENERRRLKVFEELLKKQENMKFKGGSLQTMNMAMYNLREDKQDIHSDQYKRREELTRIEQLSPDAVRDQDLVTNQFVDMESSIIGIAKQQQHSSEGILKGIDNKYRGGMDGASSTVTSMKENIENLVSQSDIDKMKDKVAKINRIIKDGITKEERTQLADLGVVISARQKKGIGSSAIIQRDAVAEAVQKRDAIITATKEMEAVRQQGSANLTNVTAPVINNSNSSTSVVTPVMHRNVDAPPGTNRAHFLR